MARWILSPAEYARHEENNALATQLGVQPQLAAPRWVWVGAWKVQDAILKRVGTPESCKALWVLWNKAADSSSWSLDLLPSPLRTILRLSRWFWPRLHHANIEVRTVYVNRLLEQALTSLDHETSCVVSLGAGYDVRLTQLLSEGRIARAYELDLPSVAEAKRTLLQQQLQRKRPQAKLPQVVGVDLNDVEETRRVLDNILVEPRGAIVLLEGVLLYLQEPAQLLALLRTYPNVTLVFCDRIPEGALADWQVSEWQTKPGMATHMGLAR